MADGPAPPEPPRRRAFRDGVLAAVVVVAIFPDVVLGGASLAASHAQTTVARPAGWRPTSLLPGVAPGNPAAGLVDPSAGALQSEPAHPWLARTLRAGDSPWWNPYSAGGSVGPETLVDSKLSPFSVLVALLGGGTGAFHLVLLFLMTASTWALAGALREGGATGLEPGLGAALFLLNGFAIGHLPNPSFHVYLLAPLLWWSLLRATRDPTAASVSLASLAWGALLLTTFVPVIVVVLLAVSALAAVQGRDRPRRTALVLAGVATAGAALCAWLWLPIVEGLTTVDLFRSYEAREVTFSVPPLQLLSLVTPRHYFEAYAFGQSPPGLDPAVGFRDSVPHMGVVPLLLCAHALGRGAPLTGRVAAVVALLAAGRIFGAPFVADLLGRAPGLSLVRPPYWAAAVGLGVTVGAAHGLACVQPGRAASRPALVAAGLMVLVVVWTGWRLGAPTVQPFRRHVEVTVGLVVAATTVLVLARRSRSATPYRVALVALAALELMAYRNLTRSPRYDLVSDPPAWVEVVRRAAEGGRTLSVGAFRTLTPEWGAAFGIRQADTLLPAALPWYREQFSRAVGAPQPGIVWVAHLHGSAFGPIDRAELDRLTVRCIVVDASEQAAVRLLRADGYPVLLEDGERIVFENPTALPRAHVAPALARGATPGSARGEDALQVTVTEDADLLEAARLLDVPSAPPPGRRAAQAGVRFVDEGNAHVTLEVDLPWPGVLVLADTWHPRWRAEVDGVEGPVGRVDGAARGVALRAGRHLVQLRYRPATLTAGIALSLLSALGLGAWWILAVRRRGVTTPTPTPAATPPATPTPTPPTT